MAQDRQTFADQVTAGSGQDVRACYQCRKCTAGCPVAEFMDIPPHALNRLVQYGRRDDVLGSSAIWLCAGCETCGTRCPNGIDIAKVMDDLKRRVVREGIRGRERKIRVMHQVFLSGVRKRGRMHELSLIRDMRLKTGGLFKDMKLGIRMFQAGKLSILPPRVKNTSALKKLFARARRMS